MHTQAQYFRTHQQHKCTSALIRAPTNICVSKHKKHAHLQITHAHEHHHHMQAGTLIRMVDGAPPRADHHTLLARACRALEEAADTDENFVSSELQLDYQQAIEVGVYV